MNYSASGRLRKGFLNQFLESVSPETLVMGPILPFHIAEKIDDIREIYQTVRKLNTFVFSLSNFAVDENFP